MPLCLRKGSKDDRNGISGLRFVEGSEDDRNAENVHSIYSDGALVTINDHL